MYRDIIRSVTRTSHILLSIQVFSSQVYVLGCMCLANFLKRLSLEILYSTSALYSWPDTSAHQLWVGRLSFLCNVKRVRACSIPTKFLTTMVWGTWLDPQKVPDIIMLMPMTRLLHYTFRDGNQTLLLHIEFAELGCLWFVALFQ